jgi:aminoglycoside 2''-phosphotransferase
MLQRLIDHLSEAFPDLVIGSARMISGHGQNNAVLVVNESLVFRFPLYDTGVASLEREIAILRGIRPYLALATPDPTYVSLDNRSVGKVCLGYPMIPGTPLWQQTLDSIPDAATLRSLGTQVGGFLRQLHAIPIREVLPHEAAGFDPLATWKSLFGRMRGRLYRHMRPDAQAATTQHFESFFASATAFTISPVLIHGDFGPGNILVDPETWKITGVIDFSSAGIGDAAIDFAAAPGKPTAFFDGLVGAYPDVANATDREQFYKGTFALQEALFGIESGDEEAFRRGIAAYV